MWGVGIRERRIKMPKKIRNEMEIIHRVDEGLQK